MKSLLELYNEASPTDSYYTSPGKVRDKVATVKAGDEGVDFFDTTDTYQKNFIERGFNDKIVVQSTADDSTNGNFTKKSLLFYKEHVAERAQPTNGIHFYNQRDDKTWYTTRNSERRGVTQTYQI
jgi:hypothetical protein